MNPAETLKAQHADLLEIVGDIGALITKDDLNGCAQDLRRLLTKLADDIEAHLVTEDRIWYPTLLKSRDNEVCITAQRFIAEWGGLIQAFRDYDAKWRSADEIAQGAAAFITDTRQISADLEDRIAREEDELIPLWLESRGDAA